MSERILTTSRNSRARAVTKEYIEATAAAIHDVAPWLTPNQITLAGLIGVAGVAKYAEVLNRTTKVEDSVYQRIIAGVVLTGLGISDGLDGALARYLQSLDDSKKSSRFGAHLDFISDRGQETVLGVSRAASAFNRNDAWGEMLAYGAIVTSPIPSGVRAFGEGVMDKVFEENGRNWLEFPGTRLGRAIIGGIATLAPEFYGVPIQNISDGGLIISNLASAVSRAKVAFGDAAQAGQSPEKRAEGKERVLISLAVEALAVQTARTTHRALRAA